MTDRAHLQLARRKVRDQSIALLIAGAVLLMPPVAGVSLIDQDIGGIPFPIIYVFLVWIVLIFGAALLSRPLRDEDDAISSVQSNTPET